MFFSVLCLLCLCVRLFICALWAPAGKGLALGSCLVCLSVGLSLSHCYSRSAMVLDLINSDLCILTYFVFTFFMVEI